MFDSLVLKYFADQKENLWTEATVPIKLGWLDDIWQWQNICKKKFNAIHQGAILLKFGELKKSREIALDTSRPVTTVVALREEKI